MEIILTHHNADFDGVAAMLGAHKLFPDAVPLLPKKLSRNVAEFLTLYQNGLPFIYWDDFHAENVTRVILVDTQMLPGVRGVADDTPVLVIDHHEPEADLPARYQFDIEEVGASTTLLVEKIRVEGYKRGDVEINSLEATLLMLGIYSDTGALTYGGTTPRDMIAASWLLEQGAVLDTVRRFMVAPLGEDQQSLFDRLLHDSETRNIQGYTVTICAVTYERYVQQINSVTQRLADMLDPDALFVVVKMPQNTQLVCRARSEAVDVGKIAAYFGGGGHARAAAANIQSLTLPAASDQLWKQLERNIQPVAQVADLMSYGVQTVIAEQPIGDVIVQMRRIGHEGYPVVDVNRQVVGLLTRRDADRAIEHGMQKSLVQDVMVSGAITLTPRDSISQLEQAMVNSGWGQIPIVDYDDSGHAELIGIVTRTDLIKHWASVHPTVSPPTENKIDHDHFAHVLGPHITELIDEVASHARRQNIAMYLVGGVVRDLMLNRPNMDIDFVIEGDAIKFAQELAAIFGGEISSFRPFGTAKWKLDRGRIAYALHLDADPLPDTIDFASSRNEFYEHPTALPSVYTSSIKLDLQRRDFTINTLAVQMSPHAMAHRLLDFYGGVRDLEEGNIRVLHSLSFVDDPTRVLRAIRFEHRLDFEIEARTAELIKTARPMLRRITGQRLRDEFDRLLSEGAPEMALMAMQERGILPAIHLAFHFTSQAADSFREARHTYYTWPIRVKDQTELYWHLVMAQIDIEGMEELCERLMFGRTLTNSFSDVHRLLDPDGVLYRDAARPSDLTFLLESASEAALLAAWIMVDETYRERIRMYVHEWRFVQPAADGKTLKEMGLPPGPHYRAILTQLRTAHLNGEIHSELDEQIMLDSLIEESLRDRS